MHHGKEGHELLKGEERAKSQRIKNIEEKYKNITNIINSDERIQKYFSRDGRFLDNLLKSEDFIHIPRKQKRLSNLALQEYSYDRIKESTIRKYRSGKNKSYDPYCIATLCICLKLSPMITEMWFEYCGFRETDVEAMAFKYTVILSFDTDDNEERLLLLDKREVEVRSSKRTFFI